MELTIIIILSLIIVGLIIFYQVKKRQKIVGTLMVVTTDEQDAPYIYLQLHKANVLLKSSKKTVLLQVKRVKYSEEKNSSSQK